jgi:hypothetical protein
VIAPFQKDAKKPRLTIELVSEESTQLCFDSRPIPLRFELRAVTLERQQVPAIPADRHPLWGVLCRVGVQVSLARRSPQYRGSCNGQVEETGSRPHCPPPPQGSSAAGYGLNWMGPAPCEGYLCCRGQQRVLSWSTEEDATWIEPDHLGSAFEGSSDQEQHHRYFCASIHTTNKLHACEGWLCRVTTIRFSIASLQLN